MRKVRMTNGPDQFLKYPRTDPRFELASQFTIQINISILVRMYRFHVRILVAIKHTSRRKGRPRIAIDQPACRAQSYGPVKAS
jgi:hypothetical protein